MSEWHALQRPRCLLQGRDIGDGPAVLFQHGLTGDESQVAECFPTQIRARRLTLDCRSHGRSGPAPKADCSFATFGDDVLAFADSRGVQQFIAGGISMGAAIALRIAVKSPERVKALILVRPAWLWWDSPRNMRPFLEVAKLLRELDPEAARALFEISDTARLLAREGPDNLPSLLKSFASDKRTETSGLIEAMSGSGPGIEASDLFALKIPTLVVGHALDAVHPLTMAETLAACIPSAQFVEITPKALDKPRYTRELTGVIDAFLRSQGLE